MENIFILIKKVIEYICQSLKLNTKSNISYMKYPFTYLYRLLVDNFHIEDLGSHVSTFSYLKLLHGCSFLLC